MAQVNNPDADLDGRTLAILELAETIVALWTFDRGSGNAPFAVGSGAAMVPNLDAEKLGGQLAAFYRDASNLSAGILSGDRLPNPLPAVSGENLITLSGLSLTKPTRLEGFTSAQLAALLSLAGEARLAYDTDLDTLVASGNEGAYIQISEAGRLRCQAYSSLTHNSTGQVLTSETWTAVALDTELSDVGGLHDNSVDNHRMTIPVGGAGFYLVTGKVGWQAHATGDRLIAVAKNATGTGFQVINVTKGSAINTVIGPGTTMVSWQGELADGDWIALNAFQDSGVNLRIGGDGGVYYTCKLEITKLR